MNRHIWLLPHGSGAADDRVGSGPLEHEDEKRGVAAGLVEKVVRLKKGAVSGILKRDLSVYGGDKGRVDVRTVCRRLRKFQVAVNFFDFRRFHRFLRKFLKGLRFIDRAAQYFLRLHWNAE